MRGEAVDYDRLEAYLRALAHARRLELLHILRVPHALADIRITPGRSRAAGSPDRIVSRQALERHLDTLQGVGVVVTTPAAEGRRKEFVVDRQRVFQLLEELRTVGAIPVGAFVSRDATVDAERPGARNLEPGPKLVLVHGFSEGRVFPLRRDGADRAGPWVIGRKPGLHVALDYDPFVSLVNSEVTLERGEYRIRDVGTSRNGTWVNWRRVEAEPVTLRPGDVVAVGRSLLVFQPD